MIFRVIFNNTEEVAKTNFLISAITFVKLYLLTSKKIT